MSDLRGAATARIPGPCRFDLSHGERLEAAHIRRDWLRRDGTFSHSLFEAVIGCEIGASPSAEEQARRYCERWRRGPPGAAGATTS